MESEVFHLVPSITSQSLLEQLPFQSKWTSLNPPPIVLLLEMTGSVLCKPPSTIVHLALPFDMDRRSSTFHALIRKTIMVQWYTHHHRVKLLCPMLQLEKWIQKTVKMKKNLSTS